VGATDGEDVGAEVGDTLGELVGPAEWTGVGKELGEADGIPSQ